MFPDHSCRIVYVETGNCAGWIGWGTSNKFPSNLKTDQATDGRLSCAFLLSHCLLHLGPFSCAYLTISDLPPTQSIRNYRLRGPSLIKNSTMPTITRTFSLTNFIVASSALCFQAFVLYPWHKELDDSFSRMRCEHAEILLESRRAMQRELTDIRRELDILTAMPSDRGQRSDK